MASFAPLPRRLDDLRDREFDLLVLGGGINGAGAARDAARRGLSVALVEREDFGYGTTGRSTRLVHGGLRYLAMYDFGLVRESLHERERLFENAPHLVQELRFLIPFYEGQKTPPWKLKVGLVLYDVLSGGSRVARHETFTRDELLDVEPGLRADGLRGGAAYSDGQVSFVERLCLENILDAVAHGAVVLNHAQADALLVEDGQVRGATVQDRMSGERVEVRARRVLNTLGPWVDRLEGLTGVDQRMTKGIHLVNPPATRHAVLLFSPDDDRVFFSIPWLGMQLVGTTDTDYRDDPGAVAADADDVDYLQRGIRFALPKADVDTVHYTWAGLRNLVPEPGKRESDVSRKHQILVHKGFGLDGLVSLVGGKITPYRATVEELVDTLGLTHKRSDTAHAPLPGAPRHGLDALVRQLEERLLAMGAAADLSARVAHTLAHTYGERAHEMLHRAAGRPDLLVPVCSHAPTLRAELPFAIETEMARSAADLLLRRTTAGWMPCEGKDALPFALDALDAALGRSAHERKADEAAYLDELATRHRWQHE